MFGLSTPENVKSLPDEAILERVQAEPWLFTAILERYQAAFLRKVKNIIFNEQDTNEVGQDACIKIERNGHRFELLEEEKISSQEISGGVRLTSQASVPQNPVSPRTLLNSIVAGFCTLTISILLLLIKDWWHQYYC